MDKVKHPDDHVRSDHPDPVRHESPGTPKAPGVPHAPHAPFSARDPHKDAPLTVSAKDEQAIKDADPRKPVEAAITPASVQRGQVARELDSNDKDRAVLTVATAEGKAERDADGHPSVDAVILSGATRVSTEAKVPAASVTTPDGAVIHTELTPNERAERYASEHKTEPPSIAGHVKVHAIKNGAYKGVDLKANDVFFVAHGDFDSGWMERV